MDEKVEFGKVILNLLSETKDEDHNISIRKLEVEGPSANVSEISGWSPNF